MLLLSYVAPLLLSYTRRCSTCGELLDHTHFNAGQCRCRECAKKRSAIVNALNRLRMRLYIEHRGSACELCFVAWPPELLVFHHVDRSTKEGPLRATEWSAYKGIPGGRTWVEAQKCAMLCPNCHGLEHLSVDNGGPTYFKPDYCTPDGTVPVTKQD